MHFGGDSFHVCVSVFMITKKKEFFMSVEGSKGLHIEKGPDHILDRKKIPNSLKRHTPPSGIFCVLKILQYNSRSLSFVFAFLFFVQKLQVIFYDHDVSRMFCQRL